MDLKLIINEIYVNQQEETLALLTKYSANQILESTIEIIKENIVSGDGNFEIKIGHIASNCLFGANSKLQLVNNNSEKKKLEYILSSISKHLLRKMFEENTGSNQKTLKNLHDSLKGTCQMHGYNFEELRNFLQFDLSELPIIKSPVKLGKNIIYYYEWQGIPHELDRLVGKLRIKEYIPNVKHFKKLFKAHDGNIRVKINDGSLDFIIVLFDILSRKNKKLIIPRGERAKKFTPLKYYLVDHEEKLLIKKEPKHIKYTINKNVEKSNKLYKKAQKLVNPLRLAS